VNKKKQKNFVNFGPWWCHRHRPSVNKKFLRRFFQKAATFFANPGLRLPACCALSVLLYVLAFGFWLDRPLSLDLLRTEMVQKAQRLAALPSPKILILAGSNASYSHSCVVIGAMLALPCENGGTAVGIGLDEIFRRDAPFLRRGDVVYLPMELAQYTATRRQYDAAADGFLLWRHDRALLAHLPPDRIFGALFCCTLADALDALAEMALARHGVSPEALLAREYDAQGDRIDNRLADAAPDLLRHPARAVPPVQDISQGYGAALIARFVAAEAARGVIVIGGLPTDFSTQALNDDAVRAIAGLYTAQGGAFLVLPNRSLYPPEDFFNGEDHLARPCQYRHSIAVAEGLAGLLRRPVVPPGAAIERVAADCPSKKGRLLFVNKKKQKNFVNLGRAGFTAAGPS
jgi:hypothetical protein